MLCNMANALSCRGYDVRIVCCDEEEGLPDFPLSKAVKFENYGKAAVPWSLQPFVRKLRALHPKRSVRRFNRAKLLANWRAEKIRGALSQEADVYISFQSVATYVLRSLLKVRKPVVTMFHGRPGAYIENYDFPIYRESVEQAAALQVLVPEFVPLAYEAMPKAKLVCIPNAIEAAASQSKLTEHRVVHIGRIDPTTKRQHLLVEAFGLIKDKFPDWELEFWGDTCEFPEYVRHIQDRIQQLVLDGRVRICGITNDVAAQFRRASIFALPSSSEGFSMALGEAMAAGLPVVGCVDCISVRSIISSGVSGILSDPTPESLAKAFDLLMGDELLRQKMGKAARAEMKQYSPDVVWGQWDSLIHSLLTQKESEA